MNDGEAIRARHTTRCLGWPECSPAPRWTLLAMLRGAIYLESFDSGVKETAGKFS